jgi:hypothetical protein
MITFGTIVLSALMDLNVSICNLYFSTLFVLKCGKLQKKTAKIQYLCIKKNILIETYINWLKRKLIDWSINEILK